MGNMWLFKKALCLAYKIRVGEKGYSHWEILSYCTHLLYDILEDRVWWTITGSILFKSKPKMQPVVAVHPLMGIMDPNISNYNDFTPWDDITFIFLE